MLEKEILLENSYTECCFSSLKVVFLVSRFFKDRNKDGMSL